MPPVAEKTVDKEDKVVEEEEVQVDLNDPQYYINRELSL